MPAGRRRLSRQIDVFDVTALTEYLRAHVPGLDEPITVDSLSGGQSNPTFRLSAGGRSYVLRKQPEGELLPSAHAVDREYRVITALGGTDVPVPRTYCYCEDRSVIGTPFFVMEFADGRHFWDPALPELDAASRAALWDDINSVIARLHNVDYAAIGLGDYGKPGNYFERQIGRWSKQYRASETERIDAMDRLLEWLPRNIIAEEASSIVHGDFRLDNLIVHAAEPRVIAVLDWELSTLGHPLADLSYHVMVWRLSQAQFRGMAGKDLAALHVPSEHEYVDRYCARTERAGLDPHDWEFCVVFSMFRLAAIIQGIAKRVLVGTAADANAADVGHRARLIADVAWRQVELMR
ncbi:MAG: phosphotransferase family protein [Burkholderiales bacterium]|nr:phosphotransferase family protein [Burkholderiales bacterium]